MNSYEIIKELNSCFGPSGNEEEVRKKIEELAKPYADDITTDVMGNLIVHMAGNGPKIMVAAHMDSIGMIATHIEKGGQIRFGAVGGLNPYAILGTPVRFKNGTCGTIHKNEDAEYARLKISDMFIDIGAHSAEEAAKYVTAGDMAVYNTPTVETETGCIISPYNDNRACCAAQLMALAQTAPLRMMRPNDVYFVFTVQEELGLRGAKPSAFAIDPDYALVCDTTVSDDAPNAMHYGSSVMGGGAAIKVMDRTIVSHPQIVKKLQDLAAEFKIPAQNDIISAGGTDAGVMHITRGGVPTSGVSVATRFVHSPQEIVSKKDIEATADLIAKFVMSDLSDNN